MRIYTSYYSNIGSINLDKYLLFSVSLSTPHSSAAIIKLPGLNPNPNLLKDYKSGNLSFEEYMKDYRLHLSRFSQLEWIEYFKSMSQMNDNKHIVLLCYESDPNKCHRSVLAKWLNYNVAELR